MEAELVKTLALGSIVYTRWPVCTPDGEIIARETVGIVADIDGVTVRVSFGDDVEAAVHELALVEMDAPQGLPHDGGLGDTLPELALRLLEERAALVKAARSVCEMADNNDVMTLDVADIVQPLRDVLGAPAPINANGHQSR